MAPESQTRKLFLLLLGFTLLLSTASAAEINLNDDTVWLNRDNQSHIEGNITDVGEEVELRAHHGDTSERKKQSIIAEGEGSFTTEDFSNSDDLSTGSVNLVKWTSADGDEWSSEIIYDSESIVLKRFSVDVKQSGTGFVNTKMGRVDYTDPVKAHLSLKGGQGGTIDKEDINVENFAFTSSELNIADKTDVDAVQDQENNDNVLATIYPEIVQDTSNQDERINLLTTYSYDGAKFSVDSRFNPHIYQMRGVPVGDKPPNTLDYSEIDGLSYDVNILSEGENVSHTLYNEDFELHIREGTNNNPIEVCQDDPDEQLWESSEIENGEGDYRLTLNSIPQLDESGTHTFITCLDPKEDRSEGDKGTVIDSIRVRNGLTLSGRVVDSENHGVRTEMTLNREDMVIPINTAEDGSYYKEIETSGDDSSYTATMNFFDRGMSSSDAEVTVTDVDFTEKDGENLAGDSESIKFQYWDNPPVEKEAISPINMMATKFAYPIAKDGHSVKMKFDPTGVDTDNLKVYGCNDWNFEGRTCLGSWEVVDDFTVNYQGWRANFDINDPYEAEDTGNGDQNILMNAYIVGTSADLVLNGGLSISGPEDGRVATGSQVEVTGNINSENENAVEGAEVDVSFYEGDTEVSSLNTAETDVTGRFAATGEAPEDPGNYSVRITADKENYNMLSKKFNNRFETFIKEGVAVRTESTVEVNPGEDVATDVTVRNTGQTDMEDISFSFEGMDSQYYSVSEASFDEISAGEEETTEVTVNLPSDYCDGGCGDWPTLEVSASATNADGEEFEAEAESLQVQISRVSSQRDSNDTEQVSSETDDTNESGSFSESVERMTGEFSNILGNPSSLNLALGLIMVFMMVLAGAVKKKDNSGGRGSTSRGDRDGRGGRPRVQKPDLGGSSVDQVDPEDEQVDNVVESIDRAETGDEDVDSQIDAIAGSVTGEEQDDTAVVEVDDEHQDSDQDEVEDIEPEQVDGEEKFVCEETGEEFDTKAALKLHRQINGLDN